MSAPAAGFDLDTFLAREGGQVEAALRRYEATLDQPALPEGLAEVVGAGLLSGGKRLRPILTIAAWRACQPLEVESPLPLYDLSVSLEIIHAYSLMHDDLPCMDDAPLRRGLPTPHTVFGVDRATRAGLLMIPLAARQAWVASRSLGLSEGAAAEVVACLCVAAGGTGMVAGQVLDLEAEGRRLDEAGLTHLHGRKTGALLAAALEIGARAAGAAPPRREALLQYGRSVGLAFQIADDVLDRTASAQTLGKRPSDEVHEKSTFASLLGVDGALARGRSVIQASVRALRDAGIHSAPLEGLAVYILGRDH